MRTVSAKVAKNRFGELLMDAQREAVIIEKNGRPVAVVRSYDEWAEIERMKLEWLKAAVAEADAAVARGEVEVIEDAKSFARDLMAEVDDDLAGDEGEGAAAT
jgi:prevent-host-death family protein